VYYYAVYLILSALVRDFLVHKDLEANNDTVRIILIFWVYEFGYLI